MGDFGDFISVTTLGDLLLKAARDRPDGDAIVFPDERATYRELAGRALERARSLIGLGIEPGQHVGILLPSSMEFLEIFFAIELIGAVAVPINARYRSHELAYLTRNADLVAIVTTSRAAEKVDFVERLTEAFPEIARAAPHADRIALADAPMLRHLVLLDSGTANGFMGRAAFDAGAAQCPPGRVHLRRARVRVRDVAFILYTSGTTSNPKGCLITHEAIIRTGQALGVRYAVTAEDRFWSPLPMFHIAAIMPICTIFSARGAYLAMRYFEAGASLKMLEAERATITFPCFAPFVADMIYHPDFPRTDLSRVRMMNSNLAVQPDAFREELRRAMPHCIQVGTYGLTESAGTVTTSALDDPYEARTGRLGKPLPGVEVRIERPDGSEAAPDEVGEIVLRSFGQFSGYYKDPEKTAEALREGWLHTGDLGSFDVGGFMMFHGRTKDMLKVGGENVAAAEIESIVAQHEAVKLCQVVGRPDPRLVEVPVAFVELKPDASATAEEIMAFCRPRIAGFKVPRDVRFIAEWPMSASKIQKFELARMLTAEPAAASR